MSTTDEQEIRDRLRSALEEVPPATPPAFAIVGQGKSIRRRRWISAGAALAAVVGLGVALPGLIRVAPAVPAAAPAYHVTVNPPRPGDPSGLIGSGTINGRRWRVTLTGSGKDPAAYGPGLTYVQFPVEVPGPGDDPVSFQTDGGPDRTAEYGPVRADVTTVTMRLADRTLLTLHPVVYRGARWLAVVVPSRLRITNVIAYGRHGELAHAVPFQGGSIRNEILGWLPPGQPGRARASVTVASGTTDGQHWSVVAAAGPWGLCLTGFPGSDCFDTVTGLVPPRQAAAIAGCGPEGHATFFLGEALTSVRSLRLKLSDGSTRRLRPVALDGTKFFAFTLPQGVGTRRWRAYNASGQQISTGTSSLGRCG
jgi:hypothetical protein